MPRSKTVNDLIESKNLDIDFGVDNLDLQYKKLTSLEGIEKFKNLKNLNVGYNQLTSLKGIEKLNSLTRLVCQNNRLDSLDGVEKLEKLEQIWCDNNKLTTLEAIIDLKNLNKIMFGSGNPYLRKYWYIGSEEDLRKFIKNELSGADVKEDFSALALTNGRNIYNLFIDGDLLLDKAEHMKNLYLRHKKLTSLDGIELFSNLEQVYLDNNKVKSLEPLRNCKKLIAINCENNSLGSLEGIEELDLKVIFCIEGNPKLKEYRGMIPEEIKTKLLVKKHLKPEDDLRGSASIMDTGLFDFKTIK